MFLSSARFIRHVVFILTEFTNPWGDYLQQAVWKGKKRENLSFIFEGIGFAIFCGVLLGFGRLAENGERQTASVRS